MNPEIVDIARCFSEHNRSLFEVGGSIRDEFLGRTSHDVDLTTSARPNETIDILKEAGYTSIYEIGKDYGTIGTRLSNGTIVEITTYRKEVYRSDSRKPVVQFGDSLEDDLSRRDFTINSLARNPLNGQVIDLYNGLADIKNRIVRCVGSDNLRFIEDPLRMMRAVRFAVQLGFTIECSFMYPSKLSIVSKERIQEEFNKILMSNNPALGIDYLCTTGLMKYIIPEFMNMVGINQGHYHIKDAYEHSLMVLHKARNRYHGDDNLIFRLAALLHDIGKPGTMRMISGKVTFHGHQMAGANMVTDILNRLRYSNEIVEAVSKLVEMHMSVLLLKETDMGTSVIRRFINRIGERFLWLLIDISICDMRSMAFDRGELIRRIIDKICDVLASDNHVPLQSPIDGNEIMEKLNIPAGKQIGEIKAYLTNLVIDGQLDPTDKEEAFTLAGIYAFGVGDKYRKGIMAG